VTTDQNSGWRYISDESPEVRVSGRKTASSLAAFIAADINFGFGLINFLLREMTGSKPSINICEQSVRNFPGKQMGCLLVTIPISIGQMVGCL
jgi:hypothetical protein